MVGVHVRFVCFLPFLVQDLNDFIAPHSSVSDGRINSELDLIGVVSGRLSPLFVGWLFLIFVFSQVAPYIPWQSTV